MRWNMLIGLLILMLAAGSAGPIHAPVHATAARVSVSAVQVSGGRQVQFRGRSTLPDGTIVQTQLFGDGVALEWWPAGEQAVVHDGQWSVRVTLESAGDVSPLDPDVNYTLRAWAADDLALISAAFPFDLAGPLPSLARFPN